MSVLQRLGGAGYRVRSRFMSTQAVLINALGTMKGFAANKNSFTSFCILCVSKHGVHVHARNAIPVSAFPQIDG